MSAALPRPQPSFLGVGEQVVRRVRGAEYAGAEPSAQTIFPDKFYPTELAAMRSERSRGDLFRSRYQQHWTPDHLTSTTA